MRLTVTSTFLLDQLRGPDNQTVWTDYVDRYRPMILGFVQRLGVAEADAQDLAQEALLTFAERFRAGSYDRVKGRLRSWLFGIVRTLVLRFRHRPQRERQAESETSFIEGLAGEGDELERIWEEEWQQAVLRQCLLEVSLEVEASTFQAFEQFARLGRPARDVAAELDISENAVFGAKRRVLRRVREKLPQLTEDW